MRRPDDAGLEARLLAGRALNEDAAIVAIPPDRALVQTTDVLTPIVNDARAFGRIAAANALSDVYAMGGEPWCAMSLAFFPPDLATAENEHILVEILQGAVDAMHEAGAVSAGGHTVQDEELKFGLAVTGIINPHHIASNDGLRPGQRLFLTKPLGTGILATAVKAHWDHAEESEREIAKWAGKLNSAGGKAIRELGLTAATDITGFGLGGHALEMALASKAAIRITASRLPLFPHVLEYAADGLIPAGTHANMRHFMPHTRVESGVGEDIVAVAFDAQTSGGLLLAVPPEKAAEAGAILLAGADLAAEIGHVTEIPDDGRQLIIEL